MDKNTADNIISELGLDQLSQEEQEQVLERIGKIIYQAVLERVLGRLSEEDAQKLDELLDGDPSGEEILAFLRERIDNIDEIIQEEAQKFRQESLQVMQEAEAEDTQTGRRETQ
jgi:hypothetical protein